MRQILRSTGLCFLLLVGTGGVADDHSSPLDAWRGASISEVLPGVERHTVHTYVTTSPESPDGRNVLLYTSMTAEGHTGELWSVARDTGRVTVLAKDVHVEDIHRAACQQWIRGGKSVVFHDLRDGEWVIVAVDVESQRERELARGRQLGFGRAEGEIVPLYGPHWSPGEHRDLELLNVSTGKIETAVKAEAVRAEYAAWFAEAFGERPVSIFFPVLGPGGGRVFFKLATPQDGRFQSPGASLRLGLVCYDLQERRFVYMNPRWGHPVWPAAADRIIEWTGDRIVTIDLASGDVTRVPGLPAFPGAHPCVSPDGRLVVTDSKATGFGGGPRDWAVVIGDFAEGEHVVLHKFDNSRGATSWRVSHPHPSFNSDGRRVYFNVSDGPWTRLHVATRQE